MANAIQIQFATTNAVIMTFFARSDGLLRTERPHPGGGDARGGDVRSPSRPGVVRPDVGPAPPLDASRYDRHPYDGARVHGEHLVAGIDP